MTAIVALVGGLISAVALAVREVMHRREVITAEQRGRLDAIEAEQARAAAAAARAEGITETAHTEAAAATEAAEAKAARALRAEINCLIAPALWPGAMRDDRAIRFKSC